MQYVNNIAHRRTRADVPVNELEKAVHDLAQSADEDEWNGSIYTLYVKTDRRVIWII
jgi:hypothetical protein